jgi:pimeloyl-ACP methyl ester carboxylesterase
MKPLRGYAQGPYGQIHYQDTVSGDIPLVLCSQSPMTSRQFDRVYPTLAAEGIRAIGIDTPGFGMSDPPDFVPAIDDYARAIPAVLDHLGIEKANVGGHHTGCKISMSAALQFPERVSSVILSGPAPMSAEQQQQFIDTVLEDEKNFTHHADGSHLTKLFTKRYPWVENLDDGTELCTGYIVQGLMGTGPFWYGHNAAFTYDGAEALTKMTHPGLILFNTGDMLYPLAEKTRELAPNFAYAEIEDGGVDITDQKPAEWTREVVSFLRSL